MKMSLEQMEAAVDAARSEREATVERVADALFAYNTPQAHHFVIHDGGYEGIARAAIAAMEGFDA